ncbi:MAG: ABC transporter ATP-binding protein [Myxococcales bacterium]
MLSLRDVTKCFGGLRAIGGVSLDVEAGQIFGLIGPNGAGKTTLFNCISGHYRPDSGEVRFQGRSLVGLKPSEIALAGLARTFQNVRLFGEMSVRENVLVAAHHRTLAGVFGSMVRSRTWNEDEWEVHKRADELLDIFGLRWLSDEQANSLPYGSQRRLEIARALMLDPELLLLDEPAAGLNSTEADKLKDQIKWLRERFNLSVVLVEHNMQVVMGACDYVHCLDHGETIAAGSPSEVQSHPAVLSAYLGEDPLAARADLPESNASALPAGGTHG